MLEARRGPLPLAACRERRTEIGIGAPPPLERLDTRGRFLLVCPARIRLDPHRRRRGARGTRDPRMGRGDPGEGPRARRFRPLRLHAQPALPGQFCDRDRGRHRGRAALVRPLFWRSSQSCTGERWCENERLTERFGSTIAATATQSRCSCREPLDTILPPSRDRGPKQDPSPWRATSATANTRHCSVPRRPSGCCH